MPAKLYSGKTGAGKSLMLSAIVKELLKRNYKWYKKTGEIRYIISNMKFNHEYLPDYASRFIRYFEDLTDKVDNIYVFDTKSGRSGSSSRSVDDNWWCENSKLTSVPVLRLRDVDFIIDEISLYFDSQNWDQVSLTEKKWIKEHRKLGLEIYGTTQDFKMVDINIRRICDSLVWLDKWFGTRDPSPTKPAPKFPFALVRAHFISPRDYKEDEPIKNLDKKKRSKFFLFNPWDIWRYDTRYMIDPEDVVYLRLVAYKPENSDIDFEKYYLKGGGRTFSVNKELIEDHIVNYDN